MEIIKSIQYGTAFMLLIISWKTILFPKKDVIDVINKKEYLSPLVLYIISIALIFLSNWKHSSMLKDDFPVNKPYIIQTFTIIGIMAILTLIVSATGAILRKKHNQKELSDVILNEYIKPVTESIFIMIFVMSAPFMANIIHTTLQGLVKDFINLFKYSF
jgi:hypothetical protein